MEEADKVIKIVKIVNPIEDMFSIKKNEEHIIIKTPKNKINEFYWLL